MDKADRLFQENVAVAPSCPACASRDVLRMGRIPDCNVFGNRILDRDIPGGDLFRCRSCHLRFRHPHLPRPELDRLYESITPENWQYGIDERPDWKYSGSWIQRNFAKGKILDVGCWRGGFLSQFDGKFAKFGIEKNRVAAEEAENRGVRIVGRDLAAMAGLREKFDAVTLFDILEHVPDPFSLVGAAASLLPSGGFLFVSSGNTDALPWRWMKGRYWYCVLSEHISFINEKWIRWTAQKLSLRVERFRIFSHSPKSARLPGYVFQMLANLEYSISPEILRRQRIWKKKLLGLPAERVAGTPPVWNSAKDHLLAVLAKP